MLKWSWNCLTCAVGGICPADMTGSELYGSYGWPSIGGGSEYNQSCFYGSNGGQDVAGGGLARRVCNTTGSWEEPNFTDCQSSELA